MRDKVLLDTRTSCVRALEVPGGVLYVSFYSNDGAGVHSTFVPNAAPNFYVSEWERNEFFK